MQLRYSFRLYPSASQRQSLARAFGCARVVFNDGLTLQEEAHKAGLPYLPDGAVLKAVTTDAKRTPQRAWLSEVSAVVLQQAVADLNSAYRAFFDSGKAGSCIPFARDGTPTPVAPQRLAAATMRPTTIASTTRPARGTLRSFAKAASTPAGSSARASVAARRASPLDSWKRWKR